MIKKDNKYLVLLVDKKRARMFILHSSGAVVRSSEIFNGKVPKKVKHGDDAWDAQNKIFRHIQVHLHRHLALIGKNIKPFIGKTNIAGILIGGHRQLFSNVKTHIPYPLSRKVKGTFITEFKVPFNDILSRAKALVEKIEK